MSELDLSAQMQIAEASKPFVRFLLELPDQAVSASGEPVTFSNDSQAISVLPVHQEWAGWLQGRQVVRRQEVAFCDDATSTTGVLRTLERQQALTRQRFAIVGGNWMTRDQLDPNSTFESSIMTPQEVLDNMDRISRQRWYPSETTVQHPRDRFSRQESAPIEQKIQAIADREWRKYSGYQANNHLDITSSWDIDLSIAPLASHFGTIRLARRAQVEDDTSLPASVDIQFCLTPKNNPRLLYGDFSNEGLRFVTAYDENAETTLGFNQPVYLSNKQQAELRNLLLNTMNSEVLRPVLLPTQWTTLQ